MKKLKLFSKIILTFVISFFMLFLMHTIHLAKDIHYIYVDQGISLLDVSYKLDCFTDILFYDTKNNPIEDYHMIAKTGIQVSCLDQNDTSYQYKLVVKGDVNGDGNINRDDMYAIKCSMVGLSTLENDFLQACDNRVNNVPSLYDLLYTQQSIKNQSKPEEEPDIEISKIELNTTSLALEIGESSTLTYTITPENTTDKEVNYSSMDPNIASVDDNGLVTALHNGFTQVLVTCANGTNAMCDVTVYTTPEELELDKKELELFVNGNSSYSLQASFRPASSNAMTNLVWNSSDSNIVSVDENGKLTAKKNGSATITATSENNLQDSCMVTVYTIPSTLILPSQISLEKGASTKIEPIIEPVSSNYDTDITWYNANENMIRVSEDGTITGLEAGTTILKAYTKNGIEATCTISVYTEIKDISLSADWAVLDLSKNNTERIFANSETGTDITNLVSWESENSNVATVDETGKITAISNGTTTITASLNENLKRTVSLMVCTSPKEISFNKNSTSLTLGETEQLSYTINPNTTNIQNGVTWSSNNTNIVSVTDTGIIEAKGIGKAMITAQCENGISSTCLVTVTKQPSKMTFDKSQILVKKSSSSQLLITFDTNLSEINLDNLSIESENGNIASFTYDTYSNNQIQVTITGLEDGHSQITANMGDTSTSCEIIVYSELSSLALYVKDTLVSDTSSKLDLSNSSSIITIQAKLNEENYDISKIITWNSDNSQVASIDNEGNVLMHSIGSTVISAQLNDTLSSSFTLVIEASPKSIDIVNSKNLYVNGDNTFTLKPTLLPTNCNIQNIVTYSSSNPTVATVDSNGIVTAHSSGKTNITATTQNGKSDSCSVTVRTAPAKISLGANKTYVKKGSSILLKPTISPSNTDTQNKISWSSSNANIAYVDSNGNVLAKQPGTATITAKTENNKSATIEIIVPDLLLKINNPTLDLSTTSTTNIMNNNSKNIGNLSYKSSNTSIATVDSNGKVTAKANGSTTIIVTESNANTQVSIPVTVKTSTKSLSLNKTSVSLDITNTTSQLSATFSPATVSSKTVTWSSSNTKVATVNNGKITRVGTGTAIITVKANDGSNKTATCTVTVKQEKMIIAGASTVVQLAGRAKCSNTSGVYSNINFYNKYGYTVRSTTDWNNKYYSSFKSHTGLTDKDADLFFVCEGGTGYKWLSGEKPKDYYSDKGTPGECRNKIDRIIQNNPNCHFTVAFMHGGNDLVKPKSQAQVEAIAKTYAKYYRSLAKAYPNHNFYISPPTPVDEKNAGDTLKINKYDVYGSNNKKRYWFAHILSSEINNSKINNLKYPNNFYNTMKNSSRYKCYDGKHYKGKDTVEFVLEEILKNSNVLSSSGKKK